MPHITVAIDSAAPSGAALSVSELYGAVLLTEAEGSIYYYFDCQEQFEKFQAVNSDYITYLDIIEA